MKRLAAAALAIAIALPVYAQRGGGGHAGGGHASFAGHGAPAAAPAFHSGFTPSHGSFGPSAAFHYGSSGAIAHPPVSYPSSMRILAPGVRYPASAPINRPAFYHPGHPITITKNHSFIIHTYPVYPYAYLYPSYVYGYLPPDMLDDSYDNYEPQPAPAPDYSSVYPQPMPEPGDGSAYPQPAPPPEYAYPQPAPAYPAYPQPAPQLQYGYPPPPTAPQMQYVPGSAGTVTLIYKNGRPPEQIQSYLATRTTLTVLDGGRRREIPLSDLDIPATLSANHQTGVDFELPGMTP